MMHRTQVLNNITSQTEQQFNRQPYPMPYADFGACDPSTLLMYQMYYSNMAAAMSAMHHGMPPTGPSPTPSAPVYGPSTQSPYAQFYDVVNNVPMAPRYDDEEAFRRAEAAAVAYNGFPDAEYTDTREPCPCIYCAASKAQRRGDEPTPVLSPQPKQEAHMMPSHGPYATELPPSKEKEEVREIAVPQPKSKRAQPQSSEPRITSEPSTPAHKPTKQIGTPSASDVTPPRRSATRHQQQQPTPPSAAPATTQIYHVDVESPTGIRRTRVVSHMDVSGMSHVVYEGDRGEDMGRVLSVAIASPGGSQPKQPLPMVVRSATEDEIHVWANELPQLAQEAVEECRKAAHLLGIPITVVDAVFQMDRQKLTFYYESEGRVDFRKLLSEMFNRYRCRIWLDRAKQ